MATAIKSFTGSQFEGKAVLADADFLPALEKINQLAADNGLHIHVTSSARQQGVSVSGAIVPPASRSNHLIGHAIDMNLRRGEDFFNSRALANPGSLPAPVQAFIAAIRSDPELRWGGDFNDPVHIDDGLNLREPATWDAKFPTIQEDLLDLTRPPRREPNEPRNLFLTRPFLQGEDVRRVQEALVAQGTDMTPDGVFGPLSDRSVTSFQERNGLVADGVVGPGTRRALGIT